MAAVPADEPAATAVEPARPTEPQEIESRGTQPARQQPPVNGEAHREQPPAQPGPSSELSSGLPAPSSDCQQPPPGTMTTASASPPQGGPSSSPDKIPPWYRNPCSLLALFMALLVAGLIALAVCVPVFYFRDVVDPVRGPRIDLGYARYAGSKLAAKDHSGIAIHRFLGMRFAKPPTGNLRWRAPVEPATAGDVQPAKDFRPICLGVGSDTTGQDEDCLFVNVWTPANASELDRKLPVWVFIQGGGYVSDANANWDGADVVARSGGNLVFVNFNYRVGLWGFLAGGGFLAGYNETTTSAPSNSSTSTASSSETAPSGHLNVGLLDQRFLLTWVQRHIAKFGGDPDHVVIHGASAGAGSVAQHTVAFGGRDDGLFAGAVAESVFLPTQPTPGELEWQYQAVVDAAGCSGGASGSESISCLRNASTATIQAANVARPYPGRTSSPIFGWGPCVDGTLIPDRPSVLLSQGRFVRVPMVYGTSTDEGRSFVSDVGTFNDAVTFLEDQYPRLAVNGTLNSTGLLNGTGNSSLASTLLEAYPQQTVPYHKPWFASLGGAYGEATFICGAVNILDAVARGWKNSSSSTSTSTSTSPSAQSSSLVPPLFSYRYNMQDSSLLATGIGVNHLLDAAAIFGPGNVNGIIAPSYSTYNAGLVAVMMDYYISFVRALDPNAHRSGSAWERWTSASANSTSRLVIQAPDSQTMEAVPADQAERCRMWLSVSKETEQ